MANVLPGATLRQLLEWGYPQGSSRPAPAPDKAIFVIHITGNPGNPIATAEGEVAWRLNDPANQNSATFFVNRDGSVVQALGDPLRMDPWSNGDVNRPDLTNPRIAAIVRDGVNANERTVLAIENVGRPSDLPITAAQEATNARIIAHYAKAGGYPVNRQTVVGHYQLNSVTRPNCPAIDKRVLDRIVAKAQALLGQTPAPTPPEDELAIQPPPFIVEKLPGATIRLEKGKTYNAFQFEGMVGSVPTLRRLNDLTYDSSTSSDVIYRANWVAGATDGYLVSPWAYLPKFGWQPDVWWSRSPNPEPTVTLPPASSDCSAQEATIAQQASAITKKNQALDLAIAHEKPHVDASTALRAARSA